MKKIISIASIFIICLSTLTCANGIDLGLSMLGINTNKIVGKTYDKIFFEDDFGRIESTKIPQTDYSENEQLVFKKGDLWKKYEDNLYYYIPYTQKTSPHKAIHVEEYREYEEGIATLISSRRVEACVLPMFFEIVTDCYIQNGRVIRK